MPSYKLALELVRRHVNRCISVAASGHVLRVRFNVRPKVTVFDLQQA